jgi:structure-specific recognition protein 1
LDLEKKFNFIFLKKKNLPFLSSLLQQDFNIRLKDIAVSYKGHNWGDFETKSQILSFNSPEGEEVFSVNMTDIKTCQTQPKSHELTLDLHSNEKIENKEDMMVQLRFVYPKEDAEEQLNDIKDKISQHIDTTVLDSGENICVLEKLPFIVPRGRYNVEIFDKFMRLSGGTFLFKINFKNINQMYLLPKPGGTHMFFVISLDTPVRITRKPIFQLLFLFEKSQVISSDSPLKMNLTNEELEEYKGKGIQNKMSGPVFEVVAKVFRAFSGKKIIGAGTYSSFENESAIKCSHKANDGHIFFLEKSFFFLYKPIIYCRHDELKSRK